MKNQTVQETLRRFPARLLLSITRRFTRFHNFIKYIIRIKAMAKAIVVALYSQSITDYSVTRINHLP